MLKYCIKQFNNKTIKFNEKYDTQSYINTGNKLLYNYTEFACVSNKFIIFKYLYNILNYEYQQLLLKSETFNNFITDNADDIKIQSWLQSIGYKN